MAIANMGDLVTTTLRNRRGQLADNILNHNAVLRFLNKQGHVDAADGGRTLVHEAAWAAAEGRSIARLAPMAKLFACQTYRDVTAMAQQVWGGVGFTIEYDIQLYFRRAKQLQLSWWDTRHLEELVASAVLE